MATEVYLSPMCWVVVYSTEIGVSYGVNVVNVNTAAFASGYYQVTLNCEGLVASESLVKE